MAGGRGDGVGDSEVARGRGLSAVVGVLIGSVRLYRSGVIRSRLGYRCSYWAGRYIYGM